MESHARTIFKSVTWRIIAVIVAFIVAYAFTRNPLESGGIAITANLINMVAYYIHERLWNRVKFGRR